MFIIVLQQILSDALNIPLTSDWQKEINMSRHEIDLLMVLKDISGVVQVETKGGKKSSEEKAVAQVEWGKQYLEKTHGTHLHNFSFRPALCMPNPALGMQRYQAANCPEFYILNDDLINSTTFETWWSNFTSKTGSQTSAPEDEYKVLVRRLILHSSLALTSLYQQLSTLLRDTHLIMLRCIVLMN